MLGSISLVFKELFQLFLNSLCLAGRLSWQTEMQCDREATLCSQEDGVNGNPAHPEGSSMDSTKCFPLTCSGGCGSVCLTGADGTGKKDKCAPGPPGHSTSSFLSCKQAGPGHSQKFWCARSVLVQHVHVIPTCTSQNL